MPPSFDGPLKVAPRLDPKTWGGQRLARFGKQLPAEPIGEALESGNDALVVGGPWAGWKLGDLARAYPDELLGRDGRAAAGSALDFPLLAKLIDAHETLSVQVHPDDAQAPPGKRGKCEAWLILDAEPGAELIVGLRGGAELDDIEARLARVPVQPGDVFLTPPGVVHAIGAGVLLYEIQQPSDVTYRLYDWGRDREMHVAQAQAVMRLDAEAQRVAPMPLDAARELLVTCPHFALERHALRDGTLPALPSSCRVLTLLDGALTLGDVALAAGQSAVLAAAAPDLPVRGSGVALIASVPPPDAAR